MKFVEVPEDEIPRRQRSTRKILREFMESGVRRAKLDLDDPELKGRGLTSIYVSLKMALKDGSDPVEVVQSQGQVYLIRTDKS